METFNKAKPLKQIKADSFGVWSEDIDINLSL